MNTDVKAESNKLSLVADLLVGMQSALVLTPRPTANPSTQLFTEPPAARFDTLHDPVAVGM